MIEQPILERVLNSALRTGGEFAEVFAEDRQNGNGMLDDGKVEQLTSGRDRGAGIRDCIAEMRVFKLGHCAQIARPNGINDAVLLAIEQMDLPRSLLALRRDIVKFGIGPQGAANHTA